MLTVDYLRNYGANVDEGLSRCLNNETFYLKLVEKTVTDSAFDNLQHAIDVKDLGRAFELAHALKGVLTNLALTPISTPIITITELLRNRTDTDYSELINEIISKRNVLVSVIG